MPVFSVRAVAAAVLCLASAAQAAITYDANVSPNVIYGSGNANGGFTIDSNLGIELGLRGKLRHDPNAGGAPQNIFNSNGDGTYSFVAQQAIGQGPTTGVWSVDYAINTNTTGQTGLFLDSLRYVFGIDIDPSQGTNFLMIDVINDPNLGNPGFGAIWWDHDMGTASTCASINPAPGCTAKVKATSAADYQNQIGQQHVAQNSQKGTWLIPGYSPTADATYSFFLAAYLDGTQVARTDIQIIQGAGGAAVPLPGTALLAALGLWAVGSARRRRAA